MRTVQTLRSVSCYHMAQYGTDLLTGFMTDKNTLVMLVVIMINIISRLRLEHIIISHLVHQCIIYCIHQYLIDTLMAYRNTFLLLSCQAVNRKSAGVHHFQQVLSLLVNG